MKVVVQENDQIPGHIRVSGKAAPCRFWRRAGKNSRMTLVKRKVYKVPHSIEREWAIMESKRGTRFVHFYRGR